MNKKIAMVALVAALLSSCTKSAEQRVEPLLVVTETVGASSLSNVKNYVGTIEEEESVSVSFTGMGILKRVMVGEGETVAQGQILAEIDDSQARNMLEIAQASCNQAEDAIGRYKQLYEKGSLPESKWIEAQSKLDEARVSVKSAEKNLADCRLVAPVSGVVGAKQANAGMTVLPSQSVLTIYRINNVKVKVAIPEREIAGINASTESRVSVEAAGVSVKGGRIEKGIVADALTHTYNIHIVLPNADHKMLPGMVCNVEINSNGADKGSYSLPVRCIQQSVDGKNFVWRVDDGDKVCRQDVKIGSQSGNRVVITEGLEEGMRVITAGYQKVSEGDMVKTQN